MLGIGQKFPQYSLTGVVSNDQAKAFQPFDQDTAQGQVARRLLLAEGLHLRVPDRDRRVRQARQGIQGA